eukprot:m51a1_g951 hypothetical protein (919) ;mRNA; f:290086-293193
MTLLRAATAKCELFLLLAAVVVAYPAYPGPHDLPLPDGSAMRVWARGDEFTGPRYVDAEGRHVYVGPDGSVSYFGPSGEPGAPLTTQRQAKQQATYSPKSLPDSWNVQARHRRAQFNEALAAIATKRRHPRSTEPLVFVLVQYKDFASGAGIKEHILNKVFGSGAGEGDTINSYFGIQSKNRFQFAQAAETSGDANDGVVGPITVDCQWVNQSGWGSYPDYSCLQRSGLLGAAEFLDLKSYDLNGDSVVSGDELHIVLVIAGGDAGSLSEAGKQRCPHVWGFMTGFRAQAQGVTFGEHVVVGENWGDCDRPFSIGVLTHELGHTLSLPDLYDQDSGGSIAGSWCLMDVGLWNNGGNNPGMMSPFLRSYLARLRRSPSPLSLSLSAQGWLTPTVVSPTSTEPIPLKPASVDVDAVLQLGSNPDGVDWQCDVRSGTGEYFLVENRQQVGVDKYAPGGGVIVWHVNEAAAPWSSHASAAMQVERIQRRNWAVLYSYSWADDVLATSAERQSLACSEAPLDNSSASCVSLSASVDAATLVATVEPWTDAACASSCVFGQGGVPAPALQYSVFEQRGHSLVRMDNKSETTTLAFTDSFSKVVLPWPFTFNAVQYHLAFVSQRGFVNFGYLNTGSDGTGSYPTLAPLAGEEATSWALGALTTQAVLTQQGDVFFVYSGSAVGPNASTYVSTGASWRTYAGAQWTYWVWTDPSAATVALRVTPRSAAGLIALPWAETFEGPLSSAFWSHVTCGEVGSACGSSSGQRALTFAGTKGLNRNAVTWGINVSACANVSVSFVVGPAVSAEGCASVAAGAWLGASMNELGWPEWRWAALGNHTEFVAVPRGTRALFLQWMLQAEDGAVFIDDISAECRTAREDTASSAAESASGLQRPSDMHSGCSRPTTLSSSTLAVSALVLAAIALPL